MKEVKTTVADIQKIDDEQLRALVEGSDHPDFVRRMVEDIKATPVKPEDAMDHIYWSWSSKAQPRAAG